MAAAAAAAGGKARVLSPQELSSKVLEYEAFVNEVLKKRLKAVNERRARLEAEREELAELARGALQLHQARARARARRRAKRPGPGLRLRGRAASRLRAAAAPYCPCPSVSSPALARLRPPDKDTPSTQPPHSRRAAAS